MARLTRDDLDRFHDYKIHVPTRTVVMDSETADPDTGESGVDAAMASRVMINLHHLDSLSDAPITILMNNIGGDEYHCFAIMDSIRACRSRVIIKVRGHAMSAGSLILQVADERVMSPLARQMVHYGTWNYDGHSKTFQKWAREGLRIDRWMEDLYLARVRERQPGFTRKRLQRMLDHDTFLSAEQSVELGLADRVEEGNGG